MKYQGKGKDDYAEIATLLIFADIGQAEKYIAENTDTDAKYWTMFQIIQAGQSHEVSFNGQQV